MVKNVSTQIYALLQHVSLHFTVSYIYIYIYIYICVCGPGSSVGIATDYGLDGLGSNPGGDEIFHLSILALGPT